MSKCIGVLTSGGDAPGMNAAIRAVVRTGIYNNCRMFAIHKGYEGLIHDQIEEVFAGSVGGIIGLGGTFIQTARSARFMEKEGRQEAYNNFKKNKLDALVVIGGDGSFRGLHQFIQEFGVQGVGIAGTIDNDCYGTEYTIGFDTAMNTALEAINKIRDTATSHSRIFIVEVMGRHAGYLAMYTAISSGAEEVFIPEATETIKDVVARLLKGKERGKQSSIIVVAEGDEFGGAMAVKNKIAALHPEWDLRVSILGHMQRGGSPSATDSLVACRLGYESVLSVLQGKTDIMIGYQGLDKDVTYIPLEDTWTKKKGFNNNWLDLARALSI
ncbi:MAG: 6-phosphofructokinase [Candidatus Margulisbacteria bacterium]|nr:6-phosphofructokinase [Candidatus Margulisiibacteriota bacterium]